MNNIYEQVDRTIDSRRLARCEETELARDRKVPIATATTRRSEMWAGSRDALGE
jgi:hypothetical protein